MLKGFKKQNTCALDTLNLSYQQNTFVPSKPSLPGFPCGPGGPGGPLAYS